MNLCIIDLFVSDRISLSINIVLSTFLTLELIIVWNMYHDIIESTLQNITKLINR